MSLQGYSKDEASSLSISTHLPYKEKSMTIYEVAIIYTYEGDEEIIVKPYSVLGVSIENVKQASLIDNADELNRGDYDYQYIKVLVRPFV